MRSLATMQEGRRRTMARPGGLLGNLFDNVRRRRGMPALTGSPLETSWPTLDVSEDDKEVLVKAEVPGMSEKDLHITYADGFLTIRGEKQEEMEEKRRNVCYRESQYGVFARSVPIGSDADWNRARAEFQRGVLRVVIPKQPGQSGKREIPVS